LGRVSRFVPSLGAPEDLPGPAGLAAFAAVVLAVSVLVLLHQEHAYENDPQLRARAGLVDTTSDISLMRTANFRRALSALVARLPPGGNIRTLSVTPVRVSATLLSSTGAETDVTITPGLHVEVRDTGNRLSDHRGLQAAAISAAAPERILLGAQRRFGLLPKEFERLVLDIPSGASPGGWAASWSQPIDDDGLVAALDGSDLRRPFTPAKGS
jgi:hypothetical protein